MQAQIIDITHRINITGERSLHGMGGFNLINIQLKKRILVIYRESSPGKEINNGKLLKVVIHVYGILADGGRQIRFP